MAGAHLRHIILELHFLALQKMVGTLQSSGVAAYDKYIYILLAIPNTEIFLSNSVQIKCPRKIMLIVHYITLSTKNSNLVYNKRNKLRKYKPKMNKKSTIGR